MESLNSQIIETIDYLNSQDAINSLKTDPYWPKWDTPWWRMLLLFEMGEGEQVPKLIAEFLITAIDNHYLKFFPFYEEEIPKDKDPHRHIICHCALGSIYRFLRSQFANIDSLVPWLRGWFLKYQLPDGGLNCDEQAYTNSGKSSIVSSLPAYEAILSCAPGGLTEDEITFLDDGAQYLIKHRLVFSTSGQLMDERFLKLQFPRFYSYDILRGLSLLTKWRKLRNKSDADEVIDYGRGLLIQKFPNKILKIEKNDFKISKTLMISSDDDWVWSDAKTFPLLDDVSRIGLESKYLNDEFEQLLK